MPRYAGYHRISRKNTTNPTEENLFKRKQSPANSSSSSVSPVSTLAKRTVQRAKTSPGNLTSQEMQQLQGTVGNRALSRMLAPQTAGGSSSVVQRIPITRNLSAVPMNSVQRWKLPWRKNETDEQKLTRYQSTLDNIDIAVDVLRVGHGIVMLPVTIIDLLSNIARPFTGSRVRNKSDSNKKAEGRKIFHNVLNGESQLVSALAGKRQALDLKIFKYMPWNILPWIIGLLRRWSSRVEKKKTALVNRMNDNN